MITNAGLKKFFGWALVTSPITLLVGTMAYVTGWRGLLFMVCGMVVLLSAIVAGILLLDSASRPHDRTS
jgi:hypothetical protein